MIHLHLEFKSLAEATPILQALSKIGLLPEESKPDLETIIEKYNVPSPAEEAIKANIPTPEEVETAVNKVVDKTTKTKKKKEPELKQEAEESEEQNLFEVDEPQPIQTDKEGLAITIETLQAKARRLVKKDAANGDKIIALLTKCKVKKIPALDTKYFVGFDKELNKLDK